MQRMNWKKEWL